MNPRTCIFVVLLWPSCRLFLWSAAAHTEVGEVDGRNAEEAADKEVDVAAAYEVKEAAHSWRLGL